uniref:C2H2-type domain-containing protein n=1 Tax=Stomoxys calcitrans TaxID=35570 RepID=A0A1I8Q7H5_STOCA
MSEDQVYKDGDIVWVKLGNNWWPGEVIDAHRHPDGIVTNNKRKLYCIVKFFNENAYEYVSNVKQIYPFQCAKKEEFLKKGLSLYKSGNKFMEKFPEDIEIAERLTRQKVSSLYINDRPDSIVKAILGQPIILSSDDGCGGTSEYREKRRSCESITKIINITPNKTPPKPIRIEQSVAIGAAYGSTSNAATANPKNISGSPRLSISSDSSSSRTNVGNSNNYRCNLCDFTSVRQNVMILHRKMHSNRNGAATTTVALNQNANAPKNRNNINNIESNTKVNKPILTTSTSTTPSKSPTPSVVSIPAGNRSTISLKRSKSPPSVTNETVGVEDKTTSSSAAITLSDSSAPCAVETTSIVSQGTLSRRSMRHTRSAVVSSPTSPSIINGSTTSAIDLPEVKPIQKIPKKRDFASLTIVVNPNVEEAQQVQKSTVTETLASTALTPVAKENVEEIRNMLMADWSDEDEMADLDNDKNKNEIKAISADADSRSGGEMNDITPIISTPTGTSTPCSTTTNKGRIRNIPKKDRRDVILNDFSPDVSVIEPAQDSSSQTLVVHLDTSNSSAVEIVDEQQHTPIITIHDDDEDDRTHKTPISKTTKKSADNLSPSSRNSDLENVEPNDKSTAASILSCFDFQDDEDGEEIDTTTATASSIPHFKKKYLSSERSLFQISCDGAAKAKHNEERDKKDQELEAEIESLLESTHPPAAGLTITPSNSFEECISVKDLPIKERSKRIFKSRNRSRIEGKLSTESLTNSVSTDESLTKDISSSEDINKTKQVQEKRGPKENRRKSKDTNERASLKSSKDWPAKCLAGRLEDQSLYAKDEQHLPNGENSIPENFANVNNNASSEKVSESMALRATIADKDQVEAETIKVLTELATVEEVPQDEGNELVVVDQQLGRTLQPSTLVESEENRLEDNVKLQTLDANNTSSNSLDIENDKSVPKDNPMSMVEESNVESNKSKGDSENCLEINHEKNVTAKPSEHNSKSIADTISEFVERDQATEDIIDEDNANDPVKIVLASEIVLSDELENLPRQDSHDATIIEFNENENQNKGDINGDQMQSTAIQENTQEALVDDSCASTTSPSAELKCENLAHDKEASIDVNTGTSTGPEVFISHRIVTTSPTDENSSMGASDTGAEFGSPTSMLSDERLPAFPFSRNETPHQEIEADSIVETIKGQCENYCAPVEENMKYPKGKLKEEELSAIDTTIIIETNDECIPANKLVKEKANLMRVTDAEAISNHETTESDFAPTLTDKAHKKIRRHGGKSSGRMLRDALKNSVSKSSDIGNDGCPPPVLQDKMSGEALNQEQDKAAKELAPETPNSSIVFVNAKDIQTSNSVNLIVEDSFDASVKTTESICSNIEATLPEELAKIATGSKEIPKELPYSEELTENVDTFTTSAIAEVTFTPKQNAEHTECDKDSNIFEQKPTKEEFDNCEISTETEGNTDTPNGNSDMKELTKIPITEADAPPLDDTAEKEKAKNHNEMNRTGASSEYQSAKIDNEDEVKDNNADTEPVSSYPKKRSAEEEISFKKSKQRKQEIEEGEGGNKPLISNVTNEEKETLTGSEKLKDLMSENSKPIDEDKLKSSESVVTNKASPEIEISKEVSICHDSNDNSKNEIHKETDPTPSLTNQKDYIIECDPQFSAISHSNHIEHKDSQSKGQVLDDKTSMTSNTDTHEIKEKSVPTAQTNLKLKEYADTDVSKQVNLPTSLEPATTIELKTLSSSSYKTSTSTHEASCITTTSASVEITNKSTNEETSTETGSIKPRPFYRKAPITRRQTICFDISDNARNDFSRKRQVYDFEDDTTLATIATTPKRTAQRKMTMPDMGMPCRALRTASPLDSKNSFKSRRSSSYNEKTIDSGLVQQPSNNDGDEELCDELLAADTHSSKSFTDVNVKRLLDKDDSHKNASKTTSNGRSIMKRRASSRRQSVTTESPPQSKIPRDAAGFVAIQPKIAKTELMVTTLGDNQISTAQQQLLQLQQQNPPSPSSSSIILNKNSNRARKPHKATANNNQQQLNPLLVQQIQVQQTNVCKPQPQQVVTQLANTQNILQFVAPPAVGGPQQQQQTTEGFLISTAATSEEENVIDSNTQLIALPTQPYPGYTETFLLCKVNGNTCKPVDNVPLYLNHQLNELVPIPSDVLEAGPKLVVNDEGNAAKEANTQQEQMEQEKSVQESGNMSNETESATGIVETGNTEEPQNFLRDMTSDEAGADADANVGEDSTDLSSSNGILLNIEGQQVLLDAATFAHLLSNPDTNTQLISDDGTEYVLTHEVLQALHMQQQQQQQQEQQQVLDITNAGVNSDIIAVAMAGSDLYGNEVLTIDTSQALQLIDDNGSVIFQQATEAPPLVQQHLTPPAVVTNAVLDQSPIMSTLEVPSNSRLQVAPHSISVPPLPIVSPSNVVFGGDAPSNLDDSLAAIGVTAQSSSMSSALGLPITVTDPNIASKVTSAGPLNEILQFVSHRPATGQATAALAAAAIAGETRIFND